MLRKFRINLTVFVLSPYILWAASLILTISSCKNNKKEASAATDTYYTCSMDPQVVEYKPGKCPICHMELTQVKKSSTEKQDEISLSEQQIQLGNIQTDSIRNSNIGDKLVLTATLNFDQMKTGSVSARVTGRVVKLYFKNQGDYVKKGDAIFDIYSEDLNNTKQEYLLALERKRDFEIGSIIDFDLLLSAARNKLLLWGMNEAQLKALEKSGKAEPNTTFFSTISGYITDLGIKEGDYIMEGGTIVKLADMSSLWAEAQVYNSQFSAIDLQSLATVQLPDFDGKEIKGRIEFVNPEINTDTRINLVRISIPNINNRLRPGMPAYVILKSREHASLNLPIDAVIRNGKSSNVWVRSGPKSFRIRMVETGLETDGRIEIRSGLSAGDIVVIAGAYLLQSEYVFKKGADPMEGMKM